MKQRRIKALTFVSLILLTQFSFFTTQASAADTVITSFSVPGAESAVFSLDGNYMWIANCSNNRIEKWSTATPTFQANISILGCAYNMAITPDGSKIVAANNSGNAINIISTSTNSIIATISVAVGPKGVNISPDGAFAWVGLSNGSLVKVNLATNTAVSTTAITGASNIQDIAVTADGATLYVCSDNSKLIKVRTSDLASLASVTLTSTCWYVAMSPNETYAYTSFYSTSTTIDRIDLTTMTKAASISGFSGSSQGVFTRDGNYFYVSNSAAGNVIKLRTSDNTIVTTITGTSGLIWHANLDPAGNYLYAMSSGGTVFKIGATGGLLPGGVALASLVPALYRTNVTLTATLESAGGIATFYQNGKYIPGCQKITAATTTVTCTYKPAMHGVIQISVKYTISGQSKYSSITLLVNSRTNTR